MTVPNDSERTRERMRELGRASGRARRKRKQRSFLDALKARVTERPEELVEQLMATPAGAVKAAAILERNGVFEPPRNEEPPRSQEHWAAVAAELEKFGVFVPFPHEAGDVTTSSALVARGHGLAAPDNARALTEDDDDGGRDVGGGGGAAGESVGAPSTHRNVPSGSAPAPPPSDLGPTSAPAPPPSEIESHRTPRPHPRYPDPRAEEVHRRRLELGLPTGNARDPYLAVGDDGVRTEPSTASAVRSALAVDNSAEQLP